jgi:tRNA dimethylallyltransferase
VITPRGPVLALVGPTASGKTALSLVLARRLEGEVISMDSRQVYRRMDIGTAKVTREERALVPHHGLDLVDPDEPYSAGRFAREARGWIREIRGRGRLPLLVGGTGFFLRALTDPVFREPPMDRERRNRLRAWLAERPREELARWVRALDPRRAGVAEAGGTQRLSRALEVPLLTGRPLTWWHDHAPPEADPVPVRIVVMTLPREELYRRIDLRAESIFREGLLDEVRALRDAGYGPEDPGMTGTGYREALRVLQGELALDEAIQVVQGATRGYARRQLTWIRNQLPEDRLEVDGLLPLDEQADRVEAWWSGTGGGDGV